ncbi:XRE family transcriptional regulator [Chromobacterium violaceum]|uniref:XRE family transcriptional regulator n=1 Tax=Chromobacterium violaceum TaxID=536 RepID=UPI0015FCCD19|nr:LexA family transcriptional regulator [Chromobacterium violaceum]MBA8734209.1 LexA family transcriptional regulator [Chromobacterium violaceum]
MNGIGKRILELRKLANLSQPELAARCGWDSQSRISQYENDRREPSLSDIDLLAKALGVTSQHLLFGTPADQQDNSAGDGSTSTYRASPFLEVPLSRITINKERQPKLDRTSDTPAAISFKALQERGLNISNLVAIQLSDDSMRPHIESGDVLIVDTSDLSPKDGRVYVIAYGDEWFVRRIFKKPNGGMILTADNSQFREIDVQPSDAEYITIIGRMVWRGG